MDDIIGAAEVQQETGVEESQRWYESVSLEDAKSIIKANITTAARSFIAIGFYLKHIRDQELYKEDGHVNIWEFAKAEYGLSMSTASRYMTMNDRFSREGNSPVVDTKYQDFGKSQLQEMLSLTDEQMDQVTPDMTVLDIRDAGKPAAPKEEMQIPGQLDISQFPEYLPVTDWTVGIEESSEPKEQTFELSLEDMLGDETIDEEPEILIAMSQWENDGTIDDLEFSMRTFNVLKKAGIDTIQQLVAKSTDELAVIRGMSNRVMEEIHTRLNTQNNQNPKIRCFELREQPTIDDAYGEMEEDKIHESENENLTDLQIAQEELERAQNLLDKCLKDLPDESDVHIRGMKIKVAALASLVRDMDAVKNPPEKPELPFLKNNDQRAAFVDAYETWPLWVETKETGERYYRYDLQDSTSMVIRVYHSMLFDGFADRNYESRYREGYGRQEYYLLKEGKFFRDCNTNRSALIEHLKEIQKKG